MTPEQFKANWNPEAPYAGNTKETALQTSRENALENNLFISTYGHRNLKNLMTFDVDHGPGSDWDVLTAVYDDLVLPEPNYITVNPSDNCQFGYFIEGTVGTPAGHEWWKNIRKDFSDKVEADPGYGGHRMRNPLSPVQRTKWLSPHIYTMAELGAFTKAQRPEWYVKKNPLPEVGRANILFNSLSSFAYHYSVWTDPNFSTRLLLEAHRLNSEYPQPLPEAEIRSTVRSVETWVLQRFSKEDFSAIQSSRGKKSGVVRTAKKEKNNEELLAYVAAGFSNREISESIGKSLDATRKAVQRAKKEAGK
jgi:hypothetical protein